MSGELTDCLTLIGLALGPAEAGNAEDLKRLAGSIRDWEAVTQMASDRLVSTQFYTSLKQAGLLESVPSPVRERLEKAFLNNVALNSLRIKNVLELSDALEGLGVTPLFLKGASLVLAGDYPGPGHRLFSDIDFMLDPSAEALVREAASKKGGWNELPVEQMLEWETTPWMDNWGAKIDVHWRLKPFNGIPGEVTRRRLLNNALKVEYRGHKALVPSPEDRFVQSALHSTAHHAFDSALLFVTFSDLARIAHAARLDWQRISKDLAAERSLAHVMVATRAAVEFTRSGPLGEGLAIMKAADPETWQAAGPFAQKLIRMLYKPWVFGSEVEGSVLAKPDVLTSARFLFRWARRFLRPRVNRMQSARPESGIAIPEVCISPPYRKKIWDLDYPSFVLALRRFYKKSGFTTLE